MSNYSRQREIILETFKNLCHPTAEQVYDKVHLDNPTISKSTVYRNLNVLLDDKIIKKIKSPMGPDRYDYIGDEHYHVVCEECGKVFDFMYHFKNEELKKEIQNQTGVCSEVDSIVLHGICKECQKNRL